MSNKRKVLFFITGPVASEAQQELANKLTTTRQRVCFRNAEQVTPADSVEKCDAVLGDVPPSYAKFPRADAEQAESPVAATPAAPESVASPSDSPEPASTPAPAPAEAPAAPEAPTVAELSENVTIAELRAALKARGIAFTIKDKKADLLAKYNAGK